MIDGETAEATLMSLQSSIVALVENAHPQLVASPPEDLAERARRFAVIARFGKDITALAEAASVILLRSEVM